MAIDGVLFLAPLLITLLLLRETVRLLARVLTPIARHLPFTPRFGLDAPDIAAIVVLVAACFTAGLLARTSLGSAVRQKLEHLILSKMPGYTLLKSVAHGAAGTTESSDLKVALAKLDDAWLMAFIVEEAPPGRLHTVFVPSAPTPTAGSLYYLREDQIRRLDIPVSTAMKCVMRLGVGSRSLLDHSQLPADE